MQNTDRLAQEMRTRLAAERLLAHRQREMTAQTARIASQSKELSKEVVERREQARIAVSRAEELRGQNQQALTELRAATTRADVVERRLWDSVQSIRDGYALFDRNGRLVAANSAYLAPFEGLEMVDIGISYRELVHLAAEEGIVDTGTLGHDGWIAMMLERWAERAPTPRVIRLWNDQYVELNDRRTSHGDVVTLGINLTERIRREEALKDARNRADAANRAKSAFLANMSHEVRTPMNGMMAMAEILGDGDLTEEQRACLDTIRSSGEALLVIINDVLDFSKIEAEKLTLSPAPFDLEATINDVVTLLRPTAHAKGVELFVDYDLFLPVRFHADPGRIRQILTNLLGNAVKFTSEGHVRVRVSGLTTDQRSEVHLVVEDTGIGVPEEMREHIFGEFNQVDDATTRAFDGTGLGLAITKRLVTLMEGDIWVDDAPDGGAAFGIRLPLAHTTDTVTPALPDWLTRVFVVDADTRSRATLLRQLCAIGAAAVASPELDTGRDRAPGDVVFLARETAPPVLRDDGKIVPDGFRLMTARGAEGELGDSGTVVLAPFLRKDLVSALAALPCPDEVAPTRAMRVLAAEDNKTNRLILEKMLGGLDIELTIVPDGAQAVTAYLDDRPDLVITDISMPVKDGKDAAREIRARALELDHPRIPIIALTAHALDSDMAEILSAGIDRCLTKPLKRADLLREVVEARPKGARMPVIET